MCVVSMITQDWGNRNPQWYPNVPQQNMPIADLTNFFSQAPPISRQEFDALKKELEALKELLLAGKKYDADSGQPNCEDASKIMIFKKLAALVGVSMDDVFKE